MKTLEQRRAEHEKVSKKIVELGSEGLAEILKNATQVHSGIGGTAVKLEIDGVSVFAKQIALSDLEMKHPESTTNLFALPTFYQYGVGSAGFGAWRELKAHQMTTNWVLNDECSNFPLMYGHAVFPREKPEPMNKERLDEISRYWGDSPQVKERLKAIDDASNSVVVFLEAVERSNDLNPRLDYYIHPQSSDGDTTTPDMSMVERELKATCNFMESKGMLHFDAHHGNILTDGDRLYFADFGLATSLDFDLSAEEKEFFEKNRGYDLSLAMSGLSFHPRAESTEEELPILPEVREVSNRYQAASNRYHTFMKSLREDVTKTTPYPATEMQALHQQIEAREKDGEKDGEKSSAEKSEPQKPLVIFVGEHQHHNMAYGSLIENLAKQCAASGLKVQIFSEFESQTQKIDMEKQLGEELRNVPKEADFRQTTEFLDKNFIKMGDLDERVELIARKLEEHLKSGITPRQLFDQTKEQMIVSPGVFEVIESDLKTGEETGETYVEKEKKPFNLENFYHNYRAQFNHEEVHGKMLQDFRNPKKDDTDVFIIVAGFGHIYGLDKELVELADCEKFVVTNFLDHLKPELMKAEREKESRTAPIGKHGLLEFEVDPDTKKAEIPEILQTAIAQRSSKESWVERLGLKEKPSQEEKSFAKMVRSDKASGISADAVPEM